MDSVLNTYIYEIKKGTKPLALLTVSNECLDRLLDKITKNGLEYALQKIENKCNIFFGESECVEVVKTFLDKNLSQLSADKDFILGILLGYNRIQQCRRYLNKLNLHPIG